MTERKRKIWIEYVGVVVLMAALVAGGFMIWKSFQAGEEKGGVDTKTSVTRSEPTETKKVEDKTTKTEKTEEVKESKPETGKEEIKQFDGDDPNVKEELTGVITYAGVSGDNLMIRVNIDQYLSSGECKLELVNNGNVIYSDKANVTDSAATATCEGFNVLAADLPSGKINIRILVISGEKTGTIEGEVSL